MTDKKKVISILIVEDEKTSYLMLENMLKKGGYKVAGIAQSGDEAISLAKSTRPDLILMDIQLSGDIDGVETAEKIKELLNIPYIYLTSGADDMVFSRAKATMPYGYLLKPYSYNMLQASIELAISRFQVDLQLIKSEKRNSSLVGSIPDIMFAIDDTGAIADSIEEEYMRKIWPRGAVKKSGELIKTFDNTTDVQTFEYSMKSGDKIEYYEARILKTSSDKSFLSIVRKITKRKRAEMELREYKEHLEELVEQRAQEILTVNKNLREEVEMRRKFQTSLSTFHFALDQSPNMVVIIESEGEIEYINKSFEKISGYSASEIVGKNITQSDNHVIPEPETWQFLIEKGTWYGDLYSVSSSNEIFYMSAYISNITNESGEVSHYIIVAEDVTIKRQEEHALKQAQSIIDHSELENFDKELEWQEWKDKMMSRNISRTDKSLFRNIYNSFTQGAGFGSLISLLDMVQSSARKEGNQYNIDEGLYNEIMRNVTISQDAFKMFSNIDWIISNDFQPENITVGELYALLQASIDNSRSIQTIKNHHIVLNDLSPKFSDNRVNVNREYFYKVVEESLINAMKFSRQKSTIVILLTISGLSATISILNDPEKTEEGIVGVPPEYEKIVFEPFYRMTKVVFEKYHALDFGLGLSLIEKVVTKHGGEVSITNILDHSDIKKDPIVKVNLSISIPLVLEKN